MFEVGDRVVIAKPDIHEFKGMTGTVATNHLHHMFEGYQVFEVKLDVPFQPSFLRGEIVHYYPARLEQLEKTDVPAPTPKKKRKWWQWGTKDN